MFRRRTYIGNAVLNELLVCFVSAVSLLLNHQKSKGILWNVCAHVPSRLIACLPGVCKKENIHKLSDSQTDLFIKEVIGQKTFLPN